MNKKLTDNFTVKILRRVTVTVEDSINNAQYTVALTGSTVADALAAVGIKLAENHAANYEMDQALEDNMKIVVSVKEEPETTEPYEEESDNDDNDDYDDYDDYDDGYTPPVVTKAPTTQAPTTQVPTTQAPTTQAPTKPAEPTTSGRTVVSVEIYEDCDGSGHGVKVITYSDGTQEEVAF